MNVVEDIQKRIRELAELMDQYGLDHAKLKADDWHIEFNRHSPALAPVVVAQPVEDNFERAPQSNRTAKAKVPVPTGTPLTSPMTGIFYAAPSPGAEDFVSLGQTVSAGEVVGLIEAMKVFNEITAPTSGVISKIVAKSGQILNPGDVILYVG